MLHTFPTLKTDRLVLREVLPEDATSILAYLSDEHVVKQMGLAAFQSEADALEEIDWYASIRRDGTGIRFGIALQEDDCLNGLDSSVKGCFVNMRKHVVSSMICICTRSCGVIGRSKKLIC